MTMDKLNKPPRSTAGISKSRGDGIAQSKSEAGLEKNARLVKFSDAVGIRRSEIARLDGTNIK